MLGYIVFYLLVELVVLCCYRKKVDCPNFNFYILITTISGCLNRIMLLAAAYIGGLNRL